MIFQTSEKKKKKIYKKGKKKYTRQKLLAQILKFIFKNY
jgi:hypothetical protein